MSRWQVFGIHVQVGGGLGAILNCLLTLLVVHYMQIQLWVGYLLISALFGALLGGVTGAVAFFQRRRLCRTAGWVCLCGGILMLCLLNFMRGDGRIDHEVRATLIIPFVWAAALTLWGLMSTMKYYFNGM